MITFDRILPIVTEILRPYADLIEQIQPIVVNRDLNGRVRLIVSRQFEQRPDVLDTLPTIAGELASELGKHAFPQDQAILFEDDMAVVLGDVPVISIEGIGGAWLVDRLATEGEWGNIAPESGGAPRIVFFSIKGGVGRSTAIAVAAWAMAQAGNRVMVVDLDLESPGLSSGLLPTEKQPTYGVTDWLVEDLVDNGDTIFNDMVAASELSHDGEILVVPAHGADPGEYIAKLGRVWMPKFTAQGSQEGWSKRLGRLLDQLEEQWQPDLVLIDSRSGIDQVASSCVTDLGSALVLMFAIDGEQTWTGYRILLNNWLKAGVAPDIRERLQLVGSMLPDINPEQYFAGLTERGWDLFSESLYDEVPPGETIESYWNFDNQDAGAPHYPWPIRWHRGFAALASLHSHLEQLDLQQVRSVFGPLIDGLTSVAASKGDRNGKS